MSEKKYFKYKNGKLPLPVFFPDATKGVIKTLDTSDIENSKTSGILVNTYHLLKIFGSENLNHFKGIKKFMNWNGAVISDSGGFQIGSLIKNNPTLGKITDKGVSFKMPGEKEIFLSPEISIRFQMSLGVDMIVALDDFTPANAQYNEAKETVRRTIVWAERCKYEFEKICRKEKIHVSSRPYLTGVVQGGDYLDLRENCCKELVKIGFDGLGYGGWPITKEGLFNYDVAESIAKYSPDGYLLYGLGIGKPDEIVKCHGLGYTIFDCVLPTRDARHKRLYVYNFDSISKIDLKRSNFYSYYVPDKQVYRLDKSAVSSACDCLLCKNYSKAYLHHLFKIQDPVAHRLASIHNLRFYSILMERLRK